MNIKSAISEEEFEQLRKLLKKVRSLDRCKAPWVFDKLNMSIVGLTAVDELYEELTRRKRRIKHKERSKMTKDCSGYRVGDKVFCKKHGAPFAGSSSTEPLYDDHPPTKCAHPGCTTMVPPC